jgi:hypothetical protein
MGLIFECPCRPTTRILVSPAKLRSRAADARRHGSSRYLHASRRDLHPRSMDQSRARPVASLVAIMSPSPTLARSSNSHREGRRTKTNPFLYVRFTRASLLRIPVRMRRPAGARKALGFSPLVEAGRADSSRRERVPFKSASAKPFVFLARRPAAQWAADARAGGVLALLFVELAIRRNRGSVSC